MLADLRSKLKAGRSDEAKQLRVLQVELDKTAAGQERLYEAVESGLLPKDLSLHSAYVATRRGAKNSCLRWADCGVSRSYR